jgi:uncharacterized membrane protein
MKKIEILPIALILLSLMIGLYLINLVPDTMPTHWNFEGKADGFSNKYFALFFLPCLMLIIYSLLTYIPYIVVMKKNVNSFIEEYIIFKIIFVIFFFGLYIISLIQSVKPFSMNYFIIPGLAVLFYFVGRLLKRTKRNYFIGFRTPWTLNDNVVWEKTNYMAGKFFQIYAVFTLFGLFIPKYSILIILIPLFPGIAFLIYYSYLLHKKLKLKS